MPLVPRPTRDAAILASTLAAVVAARMLPELLPGAWCWGLDYGRFLSPAWRWGPWLATLVLVGAVSFPPGRSALALLVRPLAIRPVASTALIALACGAACFAFPDLTYFTGDFALRRSAVVGVTDFDRLFPQASAFDRFLHWVLPRAVASATAFSPGAIASAQGALSAALFGALAAAFARRCAAQPLAALVAAATVIGGAALGLLTGYDKSLAELSLVTLAFAVAGLGELARGRSGWVSGLMVALAIALHRSGLALVPAWLLLCLRVHGPAAGRDWRAWPWARLVPAAFMIAQLPFVWKVSHAVDARHLAPTGLGQVLTLAFEPGRLIALANLVVFLVPLLPLLAPLLLLPGALAASRTGRERALPWLGWLAVSWVVPLLAIHPVQGEFRDWDDFASAGVAMALPLGLLAARGVAKVPSALAVALIAVALVPRLQWLVLEHRPERALARIEAWADGPPAPQHTLAASTLEFVAVSHYREGRVEDGRRAMAAAIAHVPWERLYLGWANAEARAGNWPRAVALYQEAGRRFPLDTTPWLMLAQAAFLQGDRNVAAGAVAELRRLAPDDPWTARAEQVLGAMGEQSPPP